MKKLHNWREEYNHDMIGYGIDEYVKEIKLHYPEVYAKFAKGYLFMFKAIGEKRFINYAKNSLEWLIKNKSPFYENYCWGLPFKYKCVPANGPYLLTTSFCGQAFLDFYELTHESKYLEIVKSSVKWIFEDLSGEKFNDGSILFYSPYECNKYFIPNAVSISIGFLVRASKYLSKSIYQPTEKIVKSLIDFQNPDGSWYYSVKSTSIDNLHTAFVLEGLWMYYNVTTDKSILKPLIRGTDYFWNNFYESDGYGKGHVLYGFRDLNKIDISRIIKDKIIKTANLFGVLKNRNPETRLWGYAAAIRAFVYASYYDTKCLNYAIKIFNYVGNNLQDEMGYFYYRGDDKSCYMRHQAHIFEAFGVLGERLKNHDEQNKKSY